jgi:hypothetical protein
MSEISLVPFIKIKEEQDVSESCDQQISDINSIAIKSEPGVTNIESHESEKSEEEQTLNCDVEAESETKPDLSDLCPDIQEVRSASTNSFSSRQDEDELQNELTSELIIKSEHEWSDVEETQDTDNYIHGKRNHSNVQDSILNKIHRELF